MPENAPVPYRVAEWGAFFGTRARAAEIRLDVGRRTTSAVLLDFTGVEAMTDAFADELVATLATLRPVEVMGANEDVAETVRLAAARRSVTVTIRVAVPCREGFRWIGQSFAHCDECGLPAWEHAGMATPANDVVPFGEVTFVLKPWAPGEREACRAKWEVPNRG